MADKSVPTLTAAVALDGTELFHLVQSGNSRKAAISAIITYLVGVGVFDAAGLATTAYMTAADDLAAHVAASNPHPQYLKTTDADEQAQDAIGLILVANDIVYDDATPKLSTRRYIQMDITDPAGSALTTGDGQGVPFVVPVELNGWKLKSVAGHVTTVSSSGLPTVQIRNATGPTDMLTTKLTIDADEKDSSTAATPAVIDTSSSHDVLTTGDEIWVDVDVAGTGTKGLIVTLGIGAP